MPKKNHGKNSSKCKSYKDSGKREKNKDIKKSREEKRINKLKERTEKLYNSLTDKQKSIIDAIENKRSRTKKIHSFVNG